MKGSSKYTQEMRVLMNYIIKLAPYDHRVLPAYRGSSRKKSLFIAKWTVEFVHSHHTEHEPLTNQLPYDKSKDPCPSLMAYRSFLYITSLVE